MFLLLLCGFLNSNPDRPFSYFICTANFHSCLYSLLGLQNLQSQHREDTSDYSSKQCTKEINFCENHLCINFLCSRSRRLHKFLATCTDNWTNIQRHETRGSGSVSLLLSKITDARYRNYNLYIQSEGSWTPEGKGPNAHRLYKSYDGTLIKDKLQGTYSCKANRIKTEIWLGFSLFLKHLHWN